VPVNDETQQYCRNLHTLKLGTICKGTEHREGDAAAGESGRAEVEIDRISLERAFITPNVISCYLKHVWQSRLQT